MAYQGNQINYNNLNEELKNKIDKTEDINAIKTKVDNSWQKNEFNDAVITNIGNINATRIFYIAEWKAPASNLEQVSIAIPIENFNGTVKVSVTGGYNNSDAFGTFEYITHYAKIKDTLHSHQRTILKADERTATNYYFPDFNFNASIFTVPIVRQPNAINNISVKVELLTTQGGTFEMLKDATVVYEDLGTSWTGYPWTPQTTSFVQHGTGHNYILGGAMTLGGNFSISKGIPLIEMGVPNSNTSSSAQILLNASSTQDFGLEFRKNNTTYMHVMGHKDVKFIGHDDAWFSIQDLKQSVSDEKTKVASAITDKGVSTSPTATFDTMANNIRAIQTGGKKAEFDLVFTNITSGSIQSVTTPPFNFQPMNSSSNLIGAHILNGQAGSLEGLGTFFINGMVFAEKCIINNLGGGNYSVTVTARNRETVTIPTLNYKLVING